MVFDIIKYRQSIDRTIELVRNKREELHKLSGVAGTGITFGKNYGRNLKVSSNIDIDISDSKDPGKDPRLVVYIEDPQKVDMRKIPRQINGVDVVVVESGKFDAFSFNEKVRPIRPGFSISNYKTTATGTITGFPIDTTDGKRVLISNNHVLGINIANMFGFDIGQVGDAIIQPGGADLGTYPGDRIATLKRIIKINDSGIGNTDFRNRCRKVTPCDPNRGCAYNNLVDCACADIDSGIEFDENTYCYGKNNGWIDPVVGTFVKKAGRTTECKNEGYIFSIDTHLSVGYGGPTIAYSNQIVIHGYDWKPFSKPGDSGSLIVHADTNNAIGLLFAGNGSLGFTVANRIEYVQRCLQVSFGDKLDAPAPQPSHKFMTWTSCYPFCSLEKGEGEDECSCSLEGEKYNMELKFRMKKTNNAISSGICYLYLYRYGGVRKVTGGLIGDGIFLSQCFPIGLRHPFIVYAEPSPGLKFDKFCIKTASGDICIVDNPATIIPDDYADQYTYNMNIDVCVTPIIQYEQDNPYIFAEFGTY